MNVVARLVAFVVVLVLCFGAAFAVGAAVGPIDDGEPTTTTAVIDADMDMEHGG